MMIGKSFNRASRRMRVATSKPSMRGISMSSSNTSGRCSSSRAMASTPSLAVSTLMPWRSSRRLVTLRTVTESSTTITSKARRGAGPSNWRWLPPPGRRASRRCWPRSWPSRSRISTTRPSPSSVAPDNPATAANCGPRLFTTISRLGDRLSAWMANDCSLECTSSTGNGTLCPSSAGRGRPCSNSPR
ncbi:hypothetical protein D9M71_429760 [compost metagenome]